MRNIILSILLSALSLSLFGQDSTQRVTIEIDFGTAERLAQSHQVTWEEGMTALSALQYCTMVETKPVGEYIFVTDISGVRNIPTQRAWYYEINGTKPTRLAFRQPLKPNDCVKWIYREDICSSHHQAGSATIEIRFGGSDDHTKVYIIEWREGLTVLDALQSEVAVATYPARNKYIFICSIDGKRSISKSSFWTYSINGVKARKTAATQLLNPDDHIIWEYRKSTAKDSKPKQNE